MSAEKLLLTVTDKIGHIPKSEVKRDILSLEKKVRAEPH